MLSHKRLSPSDISDSLNYSTIITDKTSPTETTCRICGCTFQTNRNLKIYFSHKHKQKTTVQHSIPGFWQCGTDTRCACCQTYVKFMQSITSTTTGEIFTLLQHTTCLTITIIYLIEFTKCKDHYIGETKNPIHRRTDQHYSDINAGQKNIPTVRHCGNCGVYSLKLTVIKKVRNRNTTLEELGKHISSDSRIIIVLALSLKVLLRREFMG